MEGVKIVLEQGDSMPILQAVNLLCKAQGVKMEELADTMGLKFNTLQSRLRAKRVPLEMVEEICEVVQKNGKTRRVSLVNNSEITIVDSRGMRIKLYGDEA